MWIKYVLFIWFTATISGQSPILDSRCYLEGGGSAESFLASEDMAVGSVIGTLRINGNPSAELGDINLSLRERGSAVEIPAGTKDLVLITALDKEGVLGPSSIYVNVICDRRHSSDPSFVVPVNVRVTDVNDNAPQWIGAPYILPLSEVTVPGTRILQGARAIDKDQQGPFATVEYKVMPGPYSDYVAFVSPLEGTLVLRKPLDYELLQNFTVTLRAQDHGTPPKYSDTSLRVLVEDADDQNPKFLHDAYTAELPSDNYVGELAVKPNPIQAVDQDKGLRAPVQYAILPSSESKHFSIGIRSGVVSVTLPLGGLTLLHAVTLVIRATQINNADRYALTTLVVTAKDDPQTLGKPLTFLQTKFTTKIPENTSVGNRILALPTNRPGRYLRYSILDPKQASYFTVGTLGEIILQKPLDYEKMSKHTFKVVASDGTVNASTEVSIDVMDINDWEPRFRQSHYDFVVPMERKATAEPLPLGKLEAADGDKNDEVSILIRGAHANYFYLDADGMLWLKSNLPTNATLMHLIATATDSGTPSRSSSVPVTVTMEGMALAQHIWTPGVLSAFGVIMATFVVVIFCMAVYIWRQKRPNAAKNRVHSHEHSIASASNLVNHEKAMATNGNSTHLSHSGNIRLTNPLHNNNNINLLNDGIGNGIINGGLGAAAAAASTSMLTSNLEREAQRQRERDKDNYTATVRSIISRASAARGGLFDALNAASNASEMDRDSISNSEIGRPVTTTAWNISPRHHLASSPVENGGGGNGSVLQRSNKKLSWSNGGPGPSVEASVLAKHDFLGSTDHMGSTENNLTVYF